MRLEVGFLWPASLAPHLSPGLGPQGLAAAGGREPATCLQASSRDRVFQGLQLELLAPAHPRKLSGICTPGEELADTWTATGRWSGCDTCLEYLAQTEVMWAKKIFPPLGVSRPVGGVESEKLEWILLDFGGCLVWSSHLIGKDSEAQRRQEAPFFHTA